MPPAAIRASTENAIALSGLDSPGYQDYSTSQRPPKSSHTCRRLCGIAADHFTPFYESAATRGSVININTHTSLYPATTTTNLHMTKYDRLFQEWQAEAINLRQTVFTPQETCTFLAYKIFNNRLVDPPRPRRGKRPKFDVFEQGILQHSEGMVSEDL